MADTRADSPVSTPIKRGRPTKYNERLATEFCKRIALGNSMRTVCKSDDMPDVSTIFDWLRIHEDFAKQYARACEERAEAYVEEIFDIADDAHNDWMEEEYKGRTRTVVNREAIERSKLRADVRKWYASKVRPKKYGDKLDLTTDGKELPTPILGSISVAQLAENTHEPTNDPGH